jgi:hypothetical protein
VKRPSTPAGRQGDHALLVVLHTEDLGVRDGSVHQVEHEALDPTASRHHELEFPGVVRRELHAREGDPRRLDDERPRAQPRKAGDALGVADRGVEVVCEATESMARRESDAGTGDRSAVRLSHAHGQTRGSIVGRHCRRCHRIARGALRRVLVGRRYGDLSARRRSRGISRVRAVLGGTPAACEPEPCRGGREQGSEHGQPHVRSFRSLLCHGSPVRRSVAPREDTRTPGTLAAEWHRASSDPHAARTESEPVSDQGEAGSAVGMASTR